MQGFRGAAVLRDLIGSAGAGDAAIAAAVARIGADEVAGILVDELLNRAELQAIPQLAERPLVVLFELTAPGGPVRHWVQVGGGKTTHGPDDLGSAHATVDLPLTELVRVVFGPRGEGELKGHRIRWRDFEDQAALAADMHVVPVLQHLLSGTTRQPIDLAGLSLRQGSDKWGLHFYSQHYERHFEPYRDRPLTVLELGIGGYQDPAAGGGSLRTWKRFLPRALVFGVDIFDKSGVAEQRIYPIKGDQSDPAFLESLAAEIGPIDIVIDDGSHYCPHVVTAFHTLYKHVAPGGLYVIEDLQTSYWPGYGGSSENRNDPATSMGLLKELVDGLNHAEYQLEGYEPSEYDLTIAGMHFYHNLAVLEKGRNEEASLPRWVGRERVV
ncbi:class I SAM-dependent methyltransferase [Amycolatopsis magusensis]|uniref:class I SAM-dependent methyltransferase n=1 Tax=Amycolatopsis magusensis TaxID=882444 RepID=UPI003C309F9E